MKLERWGELWRHCLINSKQKLHLSTELTGVMPLLDLVTFQQDESLPTARMHTHTHTYTRVCALLHTPAEYLHLLANVEFTAPFLRRMKDILKKMKEAF